MKPLDFSLEEMRELLALLDRFGPAPGVGADSPRSRGELTDRLETYRAAAESRCASLRAELASAEQFAADLDETLARDHKMAFRPR